VDTESTGASVGSLGTPVESFSVSDGSLFSAKSLLIAATDSAATIVLLGLASIVGVFNGTSCVLCPLMAGKMGVTTGEEELTGCSVSSCSPGVD
jgi:hypothetical protein